MAGAYSQAIYAPDSMPAALQSRILSGELFDDSIRQRKTPAGADFIDNDLSELRALCDHQASTPGDQQVFLRTAFDHLRELFSHDRRDAIVQALQCDIRAWMDEEDSTIDADEWALFYPDDRSRPIYQRLVT